MKIMLLVIAIAFPSLAQAQSCAALFSSVRTSSFVLNLIAHGSGGERVGGVHPREDVGVLRLSKTWDSYNYTSKITSAWSNDLTTEKGQPIISEVDAYRRKSIGLIIDKYGSAVSKELAELVKRTEDNLPPIRTISIVVEKNNEVKGLLRVFDGSAAPRLSLLSNKTPAEIIFLERGIVINAIENERKLNPNVDLFEIGKFWVSNHVESTAERLIAKLLVLEGLYSISFKSDIKSNPIFFVHVVTKAHRKIYESEYGFKVVETISVDGKIEYLMKTDLTSLRTKLAQDISKLKEQHRSIMNQ